VSEMPLQAIQAITTSGMQGNVVGRTAAARPDSRFIAPSMEFRENQEPNSAPVAGSADGDMASKSIYQLIIGGKSTTPHTIAATVAKNLQQVGVETMDALKAAYTDAVEMDGLDRWSTAALSGAPNPDLLIHTWQRLLLKELGEPDKDRPLRLHDLPKRKITARWPRPSPSHPPLLFAPALSLSTRRRRKKTSV
jgi:hypothetical protein